MPLKIGDHSGGYVFVTTLRTMTHGALKNTSEFRCRPWTVNAGRVIGYGHAMGARAVELGSRNDRHAGLTQPVPQVGLSSVTVPRFQAIQSR